MMWEMVVNQLRDIDGAQARVLIYFYETWEPRMWEDEVLICLEESGLDDEEMYLLENLNDTHCLVPYGMTKDDKEKILNWLYELARNFE